MQDLRGLCRLCVGFFVFPPPPSETDCERLFSSQTVINHQPKHRDIQKKTKNKTNKKTKNKKTKIKKQNKTKQKTRKQQQQQSMLDNLFDLLPEVLISNVFTMYFMY